jgi:hypothetical protein
MIFIRNQIDEIASSRTLRWFGGLLSLTHSITFIQWNRGNFIFRLFSRHFGGAICWPFFPSCEAFQDLLNPIGRPLLFGYLAISLVVAFAFFQGRRISWAYFGLLTLMFIKAALQAIDYRMMGNYHYMPYLMTFAFLFIPRKSIVIRWLIVACYLAAGVLKLNAEWLSGAALLELPGHIPPWALRLGCAYVVVLEMILIFGLMSRLRKFRWNVFIQLILFHIISWFEVGFMYPLTMACLISIFPLSWGFEEENNHSLIFLPDHPAHVAILAVFLVAQMATNFFPGDGAITGEGRIFALNMFDSNPVCWSSHLARFRSSTFEMADSADFLRVRVKCDPIVYIARAKDFCRKNRSNPDFIDLDVNLISRRSTDTDYQPVISIRDFCKVNPDFKIFGHNSDLMKGP